MQQRSRSRVDTRTDIPGSESPDPQEEPQMEGVYIISVAARILDVHPQTLRKYERMGLINPGRTLGMLRLYSTQDLRRVRLIQYLSGRLGLNLAGVEFALGMVEKLLLLRERLGEAAQGTPFEEIIEQELAALFESTGLPLDD